MEDMRYLTFALGKGRLANQTLETFEKIGITCEEMKDKKTRKLIFVNEEYKLRFFSIPVPLGWLLFEVVSDKAKADSLCLLLFLSFVSG